MAVAGLRVLTFSSLFPSAARARHGIFVETRLRHLVRDCGIDSRVIAPVPWFPSRSPRFGPYALFAATPRRDVREGLPVSYPRYFMLPRWGVPFQPNSMAWAATGDIRALSTSGWRPDVIDAHYFYPDGVAASIVAERLGVPFVVTARGTDINVLARMPGPARRILDTARRAAAVMAVSSGLKEAMVALGVDAGKITVLRNGVDIDLFRPEDRRAAKENLGLSGSPMVAMVGNLVPEKDHALAMRALARLPGCHLAIVGDGPERPALQSLAKQLAIADRVTFLDNMAQSRLRGLYSAADATVLTSTREGWPNVVLESMACGTPVVSVDVGAVREMITRPEVGYVAPHRDPQALADGIARLMRAPPAPEEVRAHARQFDWYSISRAQFEILGRVAGSEPAGIECHASASAR